MAVNKPYDFIFVLTKHGWPLVGLNNFALFPSHGLESNQYDATNVNQLNFFNEKDKRSLFYIYGTTRNEI